MGLGLFHSSCGRAKARDQYGDVKLIEKSFAKFSQDPNPHVFKVLDSEIINNNLILLVNYPNCTTFGGNKLLLLRGTKYNKRKLDPHFFEGKHPVIARFQPNEQGWTLARECAKLIS